MASILLVAPDASAGNYVWQTTDSNGNVTAQSPVYSGGIFSNSGAKDPYVEDYYLSGGYYGDSGGNTAGYGDDAPADVGGSGEITTTFTWQPAYQGEQTPSCAILQQYAGVSAGSDGTGTGFLDDGLGDGAGVIEPGSNQLTKSITVPRTTLGRRSP